MLVNNVRQQMNQQTKQSEKLGLKEFIPNAVNEMKKNMPLQWRQGHSRANSPLGRPAFHCIR